MKGKIVSSHYEREPENAPGPFLLKPLLMRRTIDRLLRDVRQKDPHARENSKYGSVAGPRDCLRILSGVGSLFELRGGDIEEVHSYRRDLFAYDLICLGFNKSGTDELYEIHEEMEGYADLLDALQCYLPEFSLGWMFDVAHPAIETDQQVVWCRSPNRCR